MKALRLETIVAVVLGILTFADAGLVWRLKARAAKPVASVSPVRPGMQDATAPPAAIREGDAGFDDATPPPGKGWVLRYASAKCGYSLNDRNWPELAERLRAAGYSISQLAPRADDAISGDAVQPPGLNEMTYVSMDWLKRYELTITPTVIAFDETGRVVWHHRGTITDRGMADATRVLAQVR